MATIRIPPVLRPSVGGEREVSADGTSVGDVLRNLVAAHPDTSSQIFSAEGELNRFVNVYLNDEDVRVLDGSTRPSARTTSSSSSPPWPAAERPLAWIFATRLSGPGPEGLFPLRRAANLRRDRALSELSRPRLDLRHAPFGARPRGPVPAPARGETPAR